MVAMGTLDHHLSLETLLKGVEGIEIGVWAWVGVDA